MTPRFPAARQAKAAPRRRVPTIRIRLKMCAQLIWYAFLVYLGALIIIPALAHIVARHH